MQNHALIGIIVLHECIVKDPVLYSCIPVTNFGNKMALSFSGLTQVASSGLTQNQIARGLLSIYI
jgi:hypothetical protein